MKIRSLRKFQLWFLSLSLAVLSHATYAEEPSVSHGMYVGIGILGIDEEKAYSQGVGDEALFLDVGYELTVGKHFALNMAFSLPVIDDEDPFEELVETEGWYDGYDWEESSIEAWGLVLEVSGIVPVNSVFSFGGGIGYRTLTASREISFCDDCYSEDVDLDGGTYFRPYVNIETGSFNIELSYITFMSGDFTRGVSANFIWSF